MGDRRTRAFKPDAVHGLAELEAVLGLLDRLGVGTDHLHAIFVERTVLEERERGVERGLAAHRRKHRVGPLLLDDRGDIFGGDRLDIGGVGHLGIGHDRRRVRVHQHDPVAFGLERLGRLGARIIELGRLADDDRPCADDQD